MLFTHETFDMSFQYSGRQPTSTQWHHNKKWCASLKAKQIVLPTPEDRKMFKNFLDETFERSIKTKEQCMMETGGILDGAFQVAHRKNAGPHIYRNEYTKELLNMSSDGWHIPPSPNSVEFIFYNNFWLVMWYSSLKFSERAIGDLQCHTCVGNDVLIPWVKIRGLCEKSVFDKRYRLGDDKIQGIYFQGEWGTNITLAKEMGPKDRHSKGGLEFTIIHTSLEANHTIKVSRADTKSPKGTFLLGRRTLKIGHDKRCDDSKFNYTLDVVCSTCFNDEFTCDDGTCINMTKRCDNIQNCPKDRSDEEDCKVLTMPTSYRKAYAPTKTGEN